MDLAPGPLPGVVYTTVGQGLLLSLSYLQSGWGLNARCRVHSVT